MKNLLNNQAPLFVVLLCIAAFLVAYYSPIAYISDSFGSLLTSQVILEQKTIELDTYIKKTDNLYKTWYQFSKVGNHYYYKYPIGTSLIAVPFVWVDNLRGQDMSDVMQHVALENTLSALTVVFAALLIYLLGRCFLDPAYAIAVALTFIFGSSIASTMSTALWSINLVTIIALWVLLLLTRDSLKQIQVNPYGLGFLLFFAYLCRPTIAIFIGLVGIYCMVEKGWKFTFKLGFSMLIPFIAYLIFCKLEYGQWLPAYYSQSDFNFIAFGKRLYWVLFSPSRGLFVFHLYILLTLLGIIVFWRKLKQNRLFLLNAIWVMAMVFINAFWGMWGGGHSYGPRLLTESLPGWVFLSLIVMQIARPQLNGLFGASIRVLLGVFIVTGIFIHTLQGLFNENTMLWNTTANVNYINNYVVDWRYPQFLASPNQLKEIQRERVFNELPSVGLKHSVLADSPDVMFEHFTDAENYEDKGAIRWVKGGYGRIIFKFNPDALNSTQPVQVLSYVEAVCQQEVSIYLNEEKIGIIDGKGEIRGQFQVDAGLLKSDDANVLKFSVTDVADPQSDGCSVKKSQLFGFYWVEIDQ